ncbi:MAG: peptide-methionine (R)-S-oxide reductase [Flavobacteriales bacterium]|jgi:peptide-methionine (R)-S-oxide reductase
MFNWKEVNRLAISGNPNPPNRVLKSNEEWRTILSADRYFVMRGKGTERAFSSDMSMTFDAVDYICASCKSPLFSSHKKFNSGTGWPSFSEPLKETRVAYAIDSNHGLVRVEAACNSCDGHLGHVFADGPGPSGLRYCINALSLEKKRQWNSDHPVRNCGIDSEANPCGDADEY